MWEDSPEAFANTHRLTLAQVFLLQCTAEHLKARVDGGRNSKGNIVAACLLCNQSRHRSKEALDPAAYKDKVQETRGSSRGSKGIGGTIWRWKRWISLFLLSAQH
jgi:hypothetical protein